MNYLKLQIIIICNLYKLQSKMYELQVCNLYELQLLLLQITK